ncbi:MAG: glycosyltransferase family 4 protein [Gaiellaceae bacterium]
MKILIVSGIWPPDVGGPASHAPEVASWLIQRGHSVEAVVTAERDPPRVSYPVHWVSRSLAPGVRHARAVALIASRARRADVVYSTGMFGRSSLGALLARRPIVLKITADPAFERARRRGLVSGEVTDFQGGGGGPVSTVLRRARDRALRRASHVVCPSAFMRDLVVSWGVPADRVDVLPNPAPLARDAAAIDVGARPVLAFAGRLTAQKDLGVALAAVRELDDVRLLIAGDGPERARLESEAGDRVSFLGALPREAVLGVLRGADAAILTSAWENFPHGVVEALAVGTPVIATRTGGVAEIVRDGENGLLVEPGDPSAFAAAVRRYLGDPDLQTRLRAAAAQSVAAFDPDSVYGRLEAILRQATS